MTNEMPELKPSPVPADVAEEKDAVYWEDAVMRRQFSTPTAVMENPEYRLMKSRMEHYKAENVALRAQIEIYKSANRDDMQ